MHREEEEEKSWLFSLLLHLLFFLTPFPWMLFLDYLPRSSLPQRVRLIQNAGKDRAKRYKMPELKPLFARGLYIDRFFPWPDSYSICTSETWNAKLRILDKKGRGKLGRSY
jgi:hypothetical protein